MKNLWYLLLPGLLLSSCAQPDQKERPPLTVTYVGNEGFLIECGGKKILVDALFGGVERDYYDVPPDSVVELMSSAQPPFDNVDLIAVTHAHADHISTKITASHLKHNPRGILVCSQQTAQRMELSELYPEIKDRIRIVPPSDDSESVLEIAGIGLRILSTPHGSYWETDEKTGETIDRHRNVEHLEYLFTICGRTLFHIGDDALNDLERYRPFGLEREQIDLAFVRWWGIWADNKIGQRLARDTIRPKRLIFMHLSPGRKVPVQPTDQRPVAQEIIIPRRTMETWTFQ